MTKQEKLATLHKIRFELDRTEDGVTAKMKMSCNVVMAATRAQAKV